MKKHGILCTFAGHMRRLFYTTFLTLLQLCWGIKEALLHEPMRLHMFLSVSQSVTHSRLSSARPTKEIPLIVAVL